MRWKKLHDKAILPKRATEHAAGYDFYALESVRIMPQETKIVRTGITFEDMPENMYLQLSLRSGIALKRPFLLANGVGVVDSDYAGKEIGIILFNRSTNIPAVVDEGERIAQGVLLTYHTVDEEEKPKAKRRGGYGSTGTK